MEGDREASLSTCQIVHGARHTKMVVGMLLRDQECKKQIKVMGTLSSKGFMSKLKEEVEVVISCK